MKLLSRQNTVVCGFAAGAFVFDEVHAYDAKLWGGLLRFLMEFPGVPALLMSASIPQHRQKQLKNVVISGDNRHPTVAVTCTRCGFLAQHDLTTLQSDSRPGLYALDDWR